MANRRWTYPVVEVQPAAPSYRVVEPWAARRAIVPTFTGGPYGTYLVIPLGDSDRGPRG